MVPLVSTERVCSPTGMCYILIATPTYPPILSIQNSINSKLDVNPMLPGVPDCRGPDCTGCPDHCEPVMQEVCELSHRISTLASIAKDPVTGHMVRRETDKLDTEENCFQRPAKICGPPNCKVFNLIFIK